MRGSDREGRGLVTAAGVAGDAVDLRGFPPGNPHLLVPPRPRQAALAGLSLYDAVSTRQRRLLRLGRIAARVGLVPLIPRTREVAGVPAGGWWVEWLRDVAEPEVGHVRFCPRLTGESRVRCLLLADDGSPRGFGKIAAAGTSEGLARESAVHEVLKQAPPQRFRAPRLLRRGRLGDWDYLLFDAIPDAGHRPLPGDPAMVARIVDELQACLAGLPTVGAASHHVPGHGDFSPRNARITAAGLVWVTDWEEAGWMPRLADELRFWAARFRGRPAQARRHAEGVVRILRARGADEDILEAAAWPEYNTPAEQAVRDRVAALITRGEGPC